MPSEKSRSRHRTRYRKRRSASQSSSSSDGNLRKRRVEKLSKKVVKHLKKHHVATEGYDTSDNRFQDPNLSERFIWNKKIERQLESGASLKDLNARAEKDRQQQRLVEIGKVRKNREEREAERARQQDELSMIERARLAAEAANALEKEEIFLLQQAVASCRVRIENGRMRPIDALVRVLLPDLILVQTDPSYNILQKMNIDELNSLLREIAEFKVLDCHDSKHVEYWECIEVLCQHELKLAVKQESNLPSQKTEGNERPSFTRERQFYVEDEVKVLLAGKSLSELVQLESEIQDLLRTSDSIDPDYWTRVLENLKIEKLKTKIRTIQTEIQKAGLDHNEAPMNKSPKSQAEKNEVEETEGDAMIESSGEEEEAVEEIEECPSPEPVETIDGGEVVHEDEDYDLIALLRRQVKQQAARTFKTNPQENDQKGKDETAIVSSSQTTTTVSAEDTVTFNRLKSAAVSAMGSDEGYTTFNGEVELESYVYWWHEKYRPRKPKYFNRVHTGYEWNKYNQTHYDHDNPPPKVVQGYKFNIFYPDLIDKKTPPYYEIQNDPDSKDSATCWLRFKAGPPYEDLAFRIVNKDWEYSHKKGFKCTFERGILHLYFNFKRQRYRR